MLKIEPLQQNTALKMALVVGALWLAIAAVLTAHFRLYFGVEWRDAVKWGLGDGLVWGTLLVGLACAYREYFVKLAHSWSAGLFVGLAILSAVILHPASVTLLYWALDGSISRPYVEDFLHLAAKRTPQGILAGLLIAFVSIRGANVRQTSPSQQRIAASAARPYLWLKNTSGVRRLNLSSVRYVEAAGNYVSIYTSNGSYLERATLKAMAKKLEASGFQRISRKHLVNLDHVQSVDARKSKGAAVTLEGEIVLPVSRQFKAGLKNAFTSFTDGGGA